MRPHHPSAGQSGQVAVETAIIIPLYVFLILGILQLGLTAQARVLAKYAVYRAARVGALQNADPKAMEAAAVFHLLPVLVNSDKVIMPTGTSSEVVAKYARMSRDNSFGPDSGTSAKIVKVVICGPTMSELRGSGDHPLSPADQQSLYERGSSNEVDFDDPGLALGSGENALSGTAMRHFNRLRLRIQVQLLYRMPIPFANWMITQMYIGTASPPALMMGSAAIAHEGRNKTTEGTSVKFDTEQLDAVKALFAKHIYTLPINVSYAMRMQSNLFLSELPLPESNECRHYHVY